MDSKKWTEHIAEQLCSRDKRRLETAKEELILSNLRTGGPACGFLFGGTFHTNLPLTDQPAAEKKLLHPSLHQAGREYMADVAATGREHMRLRQGLGLLLNPCQGDQDIRDALPDVVVGFFPELNALSRLREEAWVFRDQPLKMHSHKLTQELLNFYACNQLLY
jgi:hypothetical protein